MAATDIKNDANLSTSLVSCWLSDSSGLLTDLVTASGNDLTNNNTVTLTTGKQGDAGDFERDNTEWLSVADTASLSFTSDMSINIWFKSESNQSAQDVVAKDQSTGNQRSYIMRVNSTGNTLGFFASTDGSDFPGGTQSVTITNGVFIMLTVVYDASAGTSELFADGSSIGSVTNGSSIFDSTADFTIGISNEGTAGSKTDGVLNQVCVWSKKLTSTEVSDLYNSGNGIPFEAAVSAFTPRVMIY